MEPLQNKILGKGGREGDKKQGRRERIMCGQKSGQSVRCRKNYTGENIYWVTEHYKSNKTSRREGGRGKERAEKMKLCQLPGRLLRGSNLQIHLSPRILGQTSLVWGGTPRLSPYPRDLRSPSGKLREQVYLLCHGVWILLHTFSDKKNESFPLLISFYCLVHAMLF